MPSDGKVEPFRTMRRQSRAGSLSASGKNEARPHCAAAEPRSQQSAISNQQTANHWRSSIKKAGPLKNEWPFRIVGLRFLALLNRSSLSGPHLPTSVAFDVCVGEAHPTVKRLALRVLASQAVDARHDR